MGRWTRAGSIALAINLLASPLLAQVSVIPGQPLTGRLSNDDASGFSGVYDCAFLQTRPGAPYRFDLRSPEFDTVLEIFRNGCQGEKLTGNDDADGTHSGLVWTATEPGVFVKVMGYNRWHRGEWTLNVTDLSAPPLSVAAPNAPPVQEAKVPSAPQQAASGPRQPDWLTLGVPVDGFLERTDDTAAERGFVDCYRFLAAEDGKYRFTVGSTAFDTFLELAEGGCTGERFAWNDDDANDPAAGTNSSIDLLASGGEVYVRVYSYEPNSVGDYTVSVQPISDEEWAADTAGDFGPDPSIPLPEAPASMLVLHAPVSGALGSQSPQWQGRPFRLFRFFGRADDEIVVRMTGQGLDAFVVLYLVEGGEMIPLIVDDDGDGSSQNSRLIHRLPVTGEYRLAATTFGPGEAGTFELNFGGAAAVAELRQEAQQAVAAEHRAQAQQEADAWSAAQAQAAANARAEAAAAARSACLARQRAQSSQNLQNTLTAGLGSLMASASGNNQAGAAQFYNHLQQQQSRPAETC